MGERYLIAIVGSGPAGISAAARAASLGLSHVLLEKSDHYADTIYKYQKGKFIMATPDVLPLRSDLEFKAGLRENILGTWDEQLAAAKVNTRFNAEVTRIKGEKGAFVLTINGEETIEADNVIMSIGLQGNLRTIGVPGADAAHVQYQLDDPSAHWDEHVVVIGAGDAAIENAIALAKQNKVTIVNRRAEFARAKTGNLNAISKAIETEQLSCAYNAEPIRVEPGRLWLKTPEGEQEVPADRVIARLGADPPRRWVESCGVVFSGKDPGAFPAVSTTYESNVPGIYIIGALAGYPLIKHCMNQGYEVVEFINGNNIEPADEPLLVKQFEALPGRPSVEAAIGEIQQAIPLFSGLTALQLREFMLDSSVRVLNAGETVFQRNDYGASLFTILRGEVEIEIDPSNPSRKVYPGVGKFFGEIGLISGRRRSATVRAGKDGAVVIETARRSALKLVNSVPSAQKVLNSTLITRQLQTYLSQDLVWQDLKPVVESAKVKRFSAGDRLIEEGARDDAVYIIRSGSVTVSKRIGGKDVVLAYKPAGHYVGEMALLRNTPRSATVAAAVATEVIVLDGAAFRELLARNVNLREKVETESRNRMLANVRREQDGPQGSGLVGFLVGEGVGEATDVLLIDESLCVRCDNCEKACAETHGGISRLNREAGPTFAMIHVPTSCRHCEHPHCMKDCPPDAIHRAPNGEVFITDACIGCGNCQVNCPYGVIQMAAPPPPKPGLWSWLLLGLGHGPGEDYAQRKRKGVDPSKKKAVKCDMCKGVSGGPACVSGCPTGAAIRVSPEQFLNVTGQG
jgi:CRP-like cAMP-binding protein/thioredoxin reductase/Fe-S-cluster-containing hydrogenase component 2